MAIQLVQENGEYNIKSQHFLIDEENDLVNLESEYSCSMGDRAELPDGTIYVRHSNDYQGDKWVVKSSGSSESSDTGPRLIRIPYTVEGSIVTMGMTWQEIVDAANAGNFLFMAGADLADWSDAVSSSFMNAYIHEDTTYCVMMQTYDYYREFTTETADGYPTGDAF